MSSRRRLFAGPQLLRLRTQHALRQFELATRLGISASYLSQLEHDDRPLTPHLIERVAKLFPLDWQDLETDEAEQLAVALREAVSDPVFEDPLPPEHLSRLAEQHPRFARRFIALHEAYRRTSQRLEMVDEAMSVESAGTLRLPWEEVRDWFHLSNNYVHVLDRAAEDLAAKLTGDQAVPTTTLLEEYLRDKHGVSVNTGSSQSLREYNAELRELHVDYTQPPASARFQIAYQLGALSLGEEIRRISETAELRTSAARQLLQVGLSNYAAGALLMPYERFRKAAREVRHDIDRLCLTFGTSFEQSCHRLSNLQRDGARGLPVFFCRVDMAGNITKRHSATRLQFARFPLPRLPMPRFGGACPLWIVHEAVAIPDRVLVQLAETPDGGRYVSMAKGLVKPSGRFDRQPRRYAVALGCEVRHAGEFIYADGLDIQSDKSVTEIGISCRICARADCDQRAYPPNDHRIEVDVSRRNIVPYQFHEEGDAALR